MTDLTIRYITSKFLPALQQLLTARQAANDCVDSWPGVAVSEDIPDTDDVLINQYNGVAWCWFDPSYPDTQEQLTGNQVHQISAAMADAVSEIEKALGL